MLASDLSKHLGLKLVNSDQLQANDLVKLNHQDLSGVGELETAQFDQICFFFSPEFKMEFAGTKSRFIVTGPDFVEPIRSFKHPVFTSGMLWISENPYMSFAKATQLFAEAKSAEVFLPGKRSGDAFIHPTAVMESEVFVGEGAEIGPFCVIRKGARIEAGAVLRSYVEIGEGSVIGKDCVIFSNVSIYENCRVGARTRIHSGAVIGADGFGYAPEFKDSLPISHHKIYHFGGVVIGEDCEIGANSCVDRGTLKPTRIGSQVKIDDLVHIGHNCQVDEGAILCGQVGLAGSAVVEKFCYLGGKTAVNNKAKVGAYSKVAGMSGVHNDVRPNGVYGGVPARPIKEFLKLNALFSRMLKKKD